MKRRIALTLAVASLAAVLAVGCSPESARVRGGGAGADIGNRHLGPALEVHGPVNPLYNTPIDSQAVKQENKTAVAAK